MPGDGILQLGATVDKTGVDSGLSSINSDIKTAVQNIAVQVEETTARTRAAWNKLNDDVKATAQNMSAESLKVAEAMKVQAAAMADVRRAWTLARDAKLGDTQTTAVLAAAQAKLTESTAAVVSAKQEEAAAIAAANREAAFSENALIAAFQRSAIVARESMTQVQEKLIETAEVGKLSAAGIGAGFSGLGALLGAGMLAGFAGHFLDELSRVNVEIGHLNVQSGISIGMLAGLQQIAHEKGSDWDAISIGLTKMKKAIADSTEPSKQLINALAGIGLTVGELRSLKPDEQLERIAVAFTHSTNEGNEMAAAMALFGRGGRALIPMLKEEGEALGENAKKAGALTGITNESVEAARRWTKATADLSAFFRSALTPALENAETAIRRTAAVAMGFTAVIETVAGAVVTTVFSMYAPFARLGVLLKDVFTGNWGAVKEDAEKMSTAFQDEWKRSFEQIKTDWQSVRKMWTERTSVKEEKSAGPDDAITPPDLNASKEALRRDEEQLEQLRLSAANKGYQLGLDGEIDFWEKRLRAAKKGSDEYKGIVSKLAGLKERALAELKNTAKPTDFAETVSVGLEGNADFSELRTNAEKSAKDLKQAYRDAAEEKIRLAQQDREQVERDTQFEVQMGRMSPQERLEAIRQAADEEERIRVQQSKFLQALDMGDVRQYDQALRQEEQATRQHAEKIKQINQQEALRLHEIWARVFQGMTDTFARNMSLWASGQQTLGQSWGRTLQGMTQVVVSNLIQQTIAYITHAATVEAVQERQKLKDAAAAARKTYVAVAQIPIVGPFIAPIAAAGAFAAVEAFEQGGIVQGMQGGAVPILAHAGERVLSAQQTANFEKMVNQNNSTSSSSEVHFHDNSSYSAIDGASVRGMVRAHGRQWRRETVRQLRLANAI